MTPTEPTIKIPISEWQEVRERLTRLEEQMNQLMGNHLKHLEIEIAWIKDRLSKGYRPPWSVVSIITFLTSLSVALIVQILFK